MTYGSFDYTSLLYLSDYLDDFRGGRFVFMEEGANKTVEPRAGRTRRWWPWGCGAGFKGAMLHLWSACCMSGGQQLPGSISSFSLHPSFAVAFGSADPRPSPYRLPFLRHPLESCRWPLLLFPLLFCRST